MDACGNVNSSCTFVIGYNDNVPPTGQPPIGQSNAVGCYQNATTVVPWDPIYAASTYSDFCNGPVYAVLTNTVVATDALQCSWALTYYYSVYDQCGNFLANQQLIHLGSDLTPPTGTKPQPLTNQNACMENAPVLYPFDPNSVLATYSDACGGVLTATQTGMTLLGNNCDGWVLTYTFTVTDKCGNSLTGQKEIISGKDLTPPTLANPNNVPTGFGGINGCYVNATTPPSNAPLFDPAVIDDYYTDQCGNTVTVMLTGTNVSGGTCGWTLVYTYKVTDQCGNSLTNQTITYSGSDLEAPTFTVPIDFTVFAGENCSYDANPGITGSPTNVMDNCDVTLLPFPSDVTAQGTCQGQTIITRTWTLMDDCLNMTTHVQTITVKDVTPPTFTAPGNTIIAKDANCNYNASVGVTGDVINEHDECDPTIDAVPSDVTAQGSCQGEVIITRTWTATDDCGNSTTHVQIITAKDLTPPVLGVLTPVELECSTGVPPAATTIGQYVLLGGASALDNCSSQANLDVTSTTGSLVGSNCNGTVTRTYWVSDDCGNSASAVQVFNISDNTPPTAIAGTIQACYPTAAEAVAAAVAATTKSDNCTPTGSLTATGVFTPGECNSTIVVTVTDLCMNTATATYQTQINCQSVRLKVFLEGAYNGAGGLTNDLNTFHYLPGQIDGFGFTYDAPPGQPYTVAPWNYTGNLGLQWGDGMGQTPYPTDVVDWILVQVRENGIAPANTVWTCAGWVHTDGTVTFPENCPGPAINIANSYYIVVQHRNHLGIMSPDFVDVECGGSYLNWDFTTSNSYQPLFRFGQKLLPGGVWGMFAANGEQVTSIQAISSPDRTTWKIYQGEFGYRPSDYIMNGFTDGFDETIWKINQNKTTGVVFY
jgi:hypothetical protein